MRTLCVNIPGICYLGDYLLADGDPYLNEETAV
jgi:hypothetical protein